VLTRKLRLLARFSPGWRQARSSIAAICGISACCLAGCGRAAEPDEVLVPSTKPAQETAPLLPVAEKAGPCDDGGRLHTKLYGALQGEIDWQGSEMSCTGMPRPDAAGARLRFAGHAGENRLALAFILALPELTPGATARELPSNLTVIEEGKGRFFNTANLDICLTDIERQDATEQSGQYQIAGTVYCIGPLAEVSGESSVSIEKLEFSGRVDWDSD
jgi:hypothetical protein